MFTASGGTVTLHDIHLRGARPLPAAHMWKIRASVLDVRGDLVLERVRVEGSELPVVVEGAARIRDSEFSGNTGAVYVNGEALIERTRFVENESAVEVAQGKVLHCTFERNRGGALDVVHAAGVMLIEASTFDANVPDGAIRLGQRSRRNVQGVLRIRQNFFRNNQSQTGAGAITVFDYAGHLAEGQSSVVRDALRQLPPASFELEYNRFIGNKGATAGAIAADLSNTGGMRIKGGVFIDNESASDGGAITWSARSLAVNNAVFRNNRATRGGALRAHSPEPNAVWTITNSVFAENLSQPASGALDTARIALRNVTIAANVGWGLVVDPADAASSLANSIISGNSSGNCRNVPVAAIHSGNIQFGADDCHDAAFTNPYLDSLYVPMFGSPALDSGDVATCQAAPVSGVDLLFQLRRRPGRCASGAYERPPVRLVRNAPRREPPGTPESCPCERPDDARGHAHPNDH
jgi:hypothetical protein